MWADNTHVVYCVSRPLRVPHPLEFVVNPGTRSKFIDVTSPELGAYSAIIYSEQFS